MQQLRRDTTKHLMGDTTALGEATTATRYNEGNSKLVM
jgi:hypothetical protein